MSDPRALIAAGHPETARAAATALRAGGNAFDAVVAAGFAAAVAEPGLTSLGGGGFLLARTAAGEETLVDFFVDTPGRGRADVTPHFTPVTVRFGGADQVFHAGHGSVAVPGCLDGYLHVHRRWGRLPLADVVAPARTLTIGGVTVNQQQARILGLLEAIFDLTPEGRAIFAPGGARLAEGDRSTNPAYAALLDAIASGAVTGAASPAFADPLVAAMDDHDGLLTRADLDAYQVIERAPLVVELPTPAGTARLATNPPPSFGGSLVVRTLQRAGVPPSGSWSRPDDAAHLVDALVGVDDEHRALQSRLGTTQISIADAAGNLASMTTSNGSCSGVFAPGWGVQLNNIMGEEDLHPEGFHAAPPGVRVGSMMAPSIVDRPDATAVVLGSGGSERIRSALATVIARLLAGEPVGAAIDHPRAHWDGATIQLEPGWPDACVAELAARRPVNIWSHTDLYFGGVHAVDTSGDAAGDPRRGGSTAVLGP